MQKKTIKLARKLLIEKKSRGEKREREIKIEIDSQKVQILACAHACKTKMLFNYVLLVGKFAFFVAKLIFSHSYAN